MTRLEGECDPSEDEGAPAHHCRHHVRARQNSAVAELDPRMVAISDDRSGCAPMSRLARLHNAPVEVVRVRMRRLAGQRGDVA